MPYHDRTTSLQSLLKKEGFEGMIIPSHDAFQSEFVPPESRRLEWLTGFSGSAGTAIILQDQCAFFTDGRYTLQALEEVPKLYQVFNSGETSPWQWLQQHGDDALPIAYDPWLMTEPQLQYYKKLGVNLKALEENPVDVLWKDKPLPCQDQAVLHSIEYAGEITESKISQLTEQLQSQKTEAFLITAPDAICWLLNIRGNDTAFTPILLSYALVGADGKVILFVDEKKISKEIVDAFGSGLQIVPLAECAHFLSKVAYRSIGIDPATTPLALIDALHGKEIVKRDDPCQLLKSCKNNVEQEGTRKAHIRDGVALTEFLCWIASQPNDGSVSELSCSRKLLELRGRQELFQQPSFESIVGFKEHGAIVHYRVTEDSDLAIKGDGLLLVDSGGQYLDGTTDVTRTIAIGQPTAEEKHCYTLVLKGHIALARAVFPQGVSGSQLDGFARQFLWQEGLDYDHGTGHGVGSYLGVHEGPQRISKMPNNVALQPGMILSNEPGYYKQDAFGIRIENLVLVHEKQALSHGAKQFIGFDTVTCAPMEPKLIEVSLLDVNEKEWLRVYHRWVYEQLASLLTEDASMWLKSVVVQFEEMVGK